MDCLEVIAALLEAAVITAFALAVGYAYSSNMKPRDEEWS